MDKVTITADLAGYTTTEVSGSVEGLFNGFHREVGVSAVDNLEEGNLRITCEIDILSTVSNELK